jgi:hypothetical protein
MRAATETSPVIPLADMTPGTSAGKSRHISSECLNRTSREYSQDNRTASRIAGQRNEPAVSPATIRRWANSTSSAMGIEMMTTAASMRL